jgi:hypothetical protein
MRYPDSTLLIPLAFALYVVMVLGATTCGCGGASQTDLFASPSTSPAVDGGPSEDHLAGSDGARSPGLDATNAGEVRGEGDSNLVPVDGPPVTGDASDALPSHDVLSDPWPADVVVERAPAPNCFVAFTGDLTCCFARNQPPVDCEKQNQPQFCSSCPQ